MLFLLLYCTNCPLRHPSCHPIPRISIYSSNHCWCPIRDYFNRNGLELSDKKRALLVDWGCNSIESLKLLESDHWDTIFDSSYKKVKLQIIKKLFHHQLKEEEVDLSK